jgi:hypothetical protein
MMFHTTVSWQALLRLVGVLLAGGNVIGREDDTLNHPMQAIHTTHMAHISWSSREGLGQYAPSRHGFSGSPLNKDAWLEDLQGHPDPILGSYILNGGSTSALTGQPPVGQQCQT